MVYVCPLAAPSEVLRVSVFTRGKETELATSSISTTPVFASRVAVESLVEALESSEKASQSLQVIDQERTRDTLTTDELQRLISKNQ